MIGFHIDMNVNEFTREYLEKWLKTLADIGYDTVVWEMEENVQWETAPPCASPEAFSKAEFKEILKFSADLGMENVPFLQTLAHCEYVLKHEAYNHLSTQEGGFDMYDPMNPDVVPFLHKWIDEIIEMFGDVKHFNIGGDECWWLGKNDAQKEFIEKHSKSELYIRHINAVAEPLLKRGIAPVIWGDMVLGYPEALEKLSRKIEIWNWTQEAYDANPRILIWSEGMFVKDEIPEHIKERFGKALFPHGDSDGRQINQFYGEDYLAAKDFKTATAPASCCWLDNIFCPRTWIRMVTSFEGMRKGILSEHLIGTELLSWTVHTYPYELQFPCIEIPSFIREYPDQPIEAYMHYLVEKHFDIEDDGTFWEACELVSKRCLFTSNTWLGLMKHKTMPPPDYAELAIAKLSSGGEHYAMRQGEKALEAELRNCRGRQAEYEQAIQLFKKFARKAKKGQEELDAWILAARNLANRAKVSSILIQSYRGDQLHPAFPLGGLMPAKPGAFKDEAVKILEEMRQLRDETDAAYAFMLEPKRRAEIMHWIYGTIENAMKKVVGE